MDFPVWDTPATVIVPEASQVRVWLCGAGPGSNLEAATFSFQVPTNGLLCAKATLPAAKTIANTTSIENCRFIFFPLIPFLFNSKSFGTICGRLRRACGNVKWTRKMRGPQQCRNLERRGFQEVGASAPTKNLV